MGSILVDFNCLIRSLERFNLLAITELLNLLIFTNVLLNINAFLESNVLPEFNIKLSSLNKSILPFSLKSKPNLSKKLKGNSGNIFFNSHLK